MIVQMIVMVWAIYCILRRIENFALVFYGIIAGGLVQLVILLLNPSLLTMEAMTTDIRFAGATNNPNSYGFLMLWTIGSSLLFWYKGPERRISIIRQAIIGAIITLATYAIILSGSRKTFVGLLFLLVGWVFINQHIKTPWGMFKLVFILASTSIGAYIGFEWMLQNTFLGWRFEEFWKLGEGSFIQALQHNIRYLMYVDGIKMFLDNPIFGVGLGHFQVHFVTGQYSHSNYIEPLATTGLIGFILFQAMFFLPLWRLMRMIRHETQPLELYQLKMMSVILCTILIIGLGAPFYSSQIVFIIITTISTYTWLRNNETTRVVG